MSFFIKIEDNGIGMRQSGIDKIFTNFSKLKNGNHLNHSGTGLGLSICKQILEKMGGKVQVKSKEGKGTTFKLTLKAYCKAQ
jgi:two-component system sensor histidine kinase/response regulator